MIIMMPNGIPEPHSVDGTKNAPTPSAEQHTLKIVFVGDTKCTSALRVSLGMSSLLFSLRQLVDISDMLANAI
jgi:hypothetical protein